MIGYYIVLRRLDNIEARRPGGIDSDGVRPSWPVKCARTPRRPTCKRQGKIRAPEHSVPIARQAVCALENQACPVQLDTGDGRRLGGAHSDVIYVETIRRVVIGI